MSDPSDFPGNVQEWFQLDDEQWEVFQALMDTPLRPEQLEAFSELLSRPTVFDKEEES